MLKDHEPDHSLHKALIAAVDDEIARPGTEGKAYEVSARGKLLTAVIDAVAKYEAIHWPLKRSRPELPYGPV